MRKHNIGRVSIVIILLNVIFALVYLADKNDTEFVNENDVIRSEMVVLIDETVDGHFLTMLENIIADNGYGKEDLSTVRSYEWYLTDNVATTEDFIIENNKITVYVDENEFQNYVTEILETITHKGE